MDTEVLLKKGHRAAAAYIHAECSRSARPETLNKLLDNLLNPSKDIDNWETIEWCKWLMAGGCTPDEFAANGKWNIEIISEQLSCSSRSFKNYVVH